MTFDVDNFDHALSLRGKISKFAANIGSCTISDERFSLFTEGFNSIHESIHGLVNPDSIRKLQTKISSLQASKPVGVDSNTLSKLWLIYEPLAQSGIDQNTQLCRYHADTHALSTIYH